MAQPSRPRSTAPRFFAFSSRNEARDAAAAQHGRPNAASAPGAAPASTTAPQSNPSSAWCLHRRGCGRVIREIFKFFTEVCRQQVPREAKRPANRLHPANILRFQPAKQAEAPPPASSSAYFGEKQAKNAPDPSRHPKQATPLVVKPLTTRGVSKSFLLIFRVFFNI